MSQSNLRQETFVIDKTIPISVTTFVAQYAWFCEIKVCTRISEAEPTAVFIRLPP